MTEKMARLWLALGGIPSQTLVKVLAHYGTALAFYEERAQAGPLLGAGVWRSLKNQAAPDYLADTLAGLAAGGIAFLTPGEAAWPPALERLYDPPAGLFAQGCLSLLQSPRAFAMVGTRRATPYGRRMAQAVARGLAQAGVTVVSGFAVGIDTASHEGCLAGGGGTIAVMGCGLNQDYPRGSGGLRQRILAKNGLLLSEYPLDAPPLAAHFPQRNRLIAGLCQGLMLVEGALRSGGMISANLASEMGLEVFAMPGPADASGSEGPHALLREGARLAGSAGDILADMGWEERPAACEAEPPQPLAPEETLILSLLKRERLSLDQLAEMSGLPTAALISHLTILELKGIIEKSPGRIYAKAL